jgi:hypothetical protein
MDNSGGPADALVGAATEAAAAVELHQTIVQSNGAVTMKRHEQIALPAGRVTEFKPGGWHVMLVEARRDLRAGDVFSLTLRFQHAGEVSVPVSVRDE